MGEQMKRVLITGGSHAELPLIESAQKLGFYVITTGNNTDGLGHKAADEYAEGDFSDKEFVLELARSKQVSGIISGCNDFAYLSSAYACEKLGLKGHDSFETANIIHNKDRFRSFTEDLGIRTPKSGVCKSEGEVLSACEELGFPVVVKPVDLTGGKGVLICNDVGETLESFKNALSVSRKDHVILEEYIKGESYGASFILKGHKVVSGVFGNELYYMNKYLVSGACTAADLSQYTKDKLCGDIEKISHKLELVDGLFHTQFIVENGCEPVIIDPCRRTPGDWYVKFAKYVTEENFPEMIVKSELGMELSVKNGGSKSNNIARMCIMTDKNGIYDGIIMSEEIREKIIDKIIWAKEGEVIEDFMKYKAGIVLLKFGCSEEMYRYYNDFHNLANIKVKQG